MTLLRRLLVLAAAKLLESGCHVRRRQASSTLAMESRREKMEEVGEASTLGAGDKAPGLELLIGPGPKSARPRFAPWGDWKGLPPDGTLRRRPGVRDPAYMLCERECDEDGDAIPEPHFGLL